MSMKLKLRDKLLVPILIVLVIGLGFSTLLTYFISRNDVQKLIEAQMLQIRDTTEKHLTTWFDRTQADITAWSEQKMFKISFEDSYMGKSARKSVNDHLNRIKKEYQFYRNLHLAGSDGTVIASSGLRVVETFNVSEEKFFSAAMNGELHVSDLMQIGTDESLAFVISSPVKKMGKVIGILFGVIDIEHFNKTFIDPVKIGETGRAFIFDTNGLVIADKERSNIAVLNIGNSDYGKNMIEKKSIPQKPIVLLIAKNASTKQNPK